MEDKSLKEKAFTGVLWSTIQKFTLISVSFMSGIVLARLLDPEDFGLLGMLSIFMMLSSVFIDAGFGAALIQKKKPTDEDYSTVFFWNLGISVTLYIILFISSPYIALFYHVPLLIYVLRVQSIVLIINALQSVQLAQIDKQFLFKKKAAILAISSVASLFVAIWLAYAGWGVWALVAQYLLQSALPTTLFWITSKWYPKLVFSMRSFKELFSFGSYILLLNLISTAANNLQGLLIGRVYDSKTMGYYSKGHSTEILASSTISQVISQVTLPLYSELQESIDRLIIAIKKITKLIAYLTFPLMFILILCAKPLFIFLYSEKWLESVPYFQMLCLAGLAYCLQGVNNQAIAAIGRSKEMFKWGLFKHIMGSLLLFVGLYFWGMKGLLLGMVIRSWLTYIVNAALVSKFIGYKLWRQLKDLAPIMGLAIGAFLISSLIDHFLSFNMYVKAIIELIVYAFCYLGVSVLLKLDVLTFVKDLMQPYIMKLYRK